MQVFELHRLIKVSSNFAYIIISDTISAFLYLIIQFYLLKISQVQKLIASSPHLLLEASTALSKPSSKSLPTTKPLVENNKKSLSPTRRNRDEPEKPAHPVECTAENAVGQTPAFISKSVALAPPTASSLGPWCPPLHQPPGQQQWLIPMMSPAEGLVYKPYPGPGFSPTGFCGPYGSSPVMMGNFMNPAYGVPAHQGMGFVPGIPHANHGYFPAYGMSVTNVGVSGAGSSSISAVGQVNHPTEPSTGIQTGHVLRHESNHPQPQSSCNNNIVSVPTTAPTASRLQPSKFSDLQRRTGSSPPNDRAQLTRTSSSLNPSAANELRGAEPGSFTERERDLSNVRRGDEQDELPLFPMAPATAGAEQPTQVIRAVPHNARSAPASAARIFRSIQEERKHHDAN